MLPVKKVSRLLAPTVPLVLEVDDGAHKLELRLAWTMRGVILTELKLRELGIYVNVIQNPGLFWRDLDSAKLTAAVWGMSSQEHPEYQDDEGFETITSFLITENYEVAAERLKDAFLESLSPKRREEIREAEKQAVSSPTPPTPSSDPTPAPVQS